jgi:hypothetical protein
LCFKKIRPTAFELLQTLVAKIIGAFFANFLCERAQDWRVKNYFQDLGSSFVSHSISQLLIQEASHAAAHESTSKSVNHQLFRQSLQSGRYLMISGPACL